MKTGTFSEYATHAGVSPAYVTKLKQAGRLVMVKVDGKDRVNFEMTDRLVANTTDMSRARNGANAKPAAAPESPAAATPAANAATPNSGDRGSTGGGGGVDVVFRQAQAKERVFSAKRAELEWKRLSGELVDAKQAERTVFDAFRALRDHAFQAPQRAAARAAGLEDMREVERVFAEELRKAFDGWEEKMATRLAPKASA